MGRLLNTHRRVVRNTRANPAISFGTTVAGGFALFGWLGWWLDQKFEREYAFTLAGVALAFLFTGYELWKIVRTPEAPPEGREGSAASGPGPDKPAPPDRD